LSCATMSAPSGWRRQDAAQSLTRLSLQASGERPPLTACSPLHVTGGVVVITDPIPPGR
jgi:hypothetical protein